MVDLTRAVLLAATLAACLKPGAEAKAPEPPDPDAEVVTHTWLVAEHMRVKGASMSEKDADDFHGRTVVVDAHGYASPWQPPCDKATREKRPRELTELFAELKISEGAATKAAAFGMTSDILEFRMTCSNRGTPLILWVGGRHAMTCFSGVCYLLKRFED